MPALGLTSLEEPIVSTDGVVDVRAFEAIAEPTFFAPVVIASDGAGLTETTLDVAGRDVVVQAWPDDPEWTAFMGGQVGTALSDLEQLIGFPARDDRAVIVRESVEPILEGFAGWFDQDTGVIEVGEDLDPALVFHEVGHAWFNDDFAPSRWINEGLAETYANLLLERTGATARQPIVPTAGAPGAQPLSEWNFPVTLPPDADSERYGYETSHFVVDALVDEVGLDAMADVLTAMERDVEAYRGDGEPQPTTAAADWRRLLDLASELGDAETAAELFRTWVAPAGDVGDFELRSTARQRYDTLVTDGDGWAAPLAVRQAMERWEFDAAAFAMTAAEAALSAAATAGRRRGADPDRPSRAVRGAIRDGDVGARAECAGRRAARVGRCDRFVVAGDGGRCCRAASTRGTWAQGPAVRRPARGGARGGGSG